MTTRLRGMTWEHARGYDCMVSASEMYAKTAGVVVDWQYRSLQSFADAPLEELSRHFDLLVIDHPHIPLAASQGALARLDGAGFDEELSRLAAQSAGASHSSYEYGGHQYGLASDAATQVAVRRPDLLRDAPDDWEAVMRLAKQGKVLWAAKPIDSYSSLITIAANNGAPAFATPGTFLRPDDGFEALDRMHELAALVPEFCFEANPIDVAEAMCRSDEWCYSPLAFGYTNYSRRGYRDVRLAYSDIPAGREGVRGSLLGGAGIAVSSYSSYADEARAFAFWVSSADTQNGVYFRSGGQPGNSSAWDNEELNSQTLDFFKGTRSTMEGAYMRPRLPAYVAFQDTVSPWVTQALRGEISDQQLITSMNMEAARMSDSR